MSLIRIADRDRVRPLHVVLIVLVLAVVAGGCLLTSAGEPEILPDGAVAWQPDSLLWAVVQLLNLRASQPTPDGVAVKSLILCLGAAIAAVAVAIAVASGPRRGEEVCDTDTVVEERPPETVGGSAVPVAWQQIPPLTAAWVFAVLYVLWSFASVTWSKPGRDIALAGSALLAMHYLWTFALGLGLTRATARYAGHVVLVTTVAVAILAVLYWRERNPNLRASYPIGNPTTLAACLIPGLILALGAAAGFFAGQTDGSFGRRLAAALAGLAVLPVLGGAFYLTSSRGAAVGLCMAFLAVLFLALRFRGRLIVTAAAVLLAFGGAVYAWHGKDMPSAQGRSASMRVRMYAWQYALDLSVDRVFLGQGQGGFARKGDALAVRDVLNDPQALEARVSHAHSEYLEVLADLGVVGLILFVGAMGLTFRAVMLALAALPNAGHRWSLILLTSAWFGLGVEEAFGVGLRLPGVPILFYTLWGLIWAMSYTGQRSPVSVLQRTPLRRSLVLGVGVLLAILTAELARRDFAAARSMSEAVEHAEAQRWDDAITRSDYAAMWHLPSQRRLLAADRQVAARLDAARYDFNQAMDRFQRAHQASSVDARILAAAQEDIERCRMRTREGLELSATLLEKAPRFWNGGWLQFQLWEVEHRLARTAQNEEEAARYMTQAVEALDRELQRQPFQPSLAATFATVAVGQRSLDELFDLAARPLRYRPFIPAYDDFLRRITEAEGFTEAYTPVLDRSLQATRVESFAEWQTPWAPERLRLCAAISLAFGRQAHAESVLEQTIGLYGKLPEPAPVGLASCYAELSQTRFLAHPGDPLSAIEAAKQVVREAPPSHIGREVIRTANELLVLYRLAADQEDVVRDRLLPPLIGRLTPEAVDREVAHRYVDLCQLLLARGRDVNLQHVQAWVNRSIQLDPGNPGAWGLVAQLSYMGGDLSTCLQALARSLQVGADPAAVGAFVAGILPQHPDHAELRQFAAWLEQEFGVAVPVPTTQPGTTTAPAASQPIIPVSQPSAAAGLEPTE